MDDRSLGARDKDKADSADYLATLRAMDRRALTGLDAVNYDTLAFVLAGRADYGRRFHYGDGPGVPYAISQITGACQSVPDFLDSQHAIATREDAEAYLARLEAFGRVLNQETEKAYADSKAGGLPPDFVVAKALAQLTAPANTPRDACDPCAVPGQTNQGAGHPGRLGDARHPALSRAGAARLAQPDRAPRGDEGPCAA